MSSTHANIWTGWRGLVEYRLVSSLLQWFLFMNEPNKLIKVYFTEDAVEYITKITLCFCQLSKWFENDLSNAIG